MFLVTSKCLQVCSHELGMVVPLYSQEWVTVSGASILIEPDPVGRKIKDCPNISVGIASCRTALSVTRGYSSLVCINGKPVVLDSLTGPTDGTPGDFVFFVRSPGQNFVECSE
jgi:hypothetical protein